LFRYKTKEIYFGAIYLEQRLIFFSFNEMDDKKKKTETTSNIKLLKEVILKISAKKNPNW
jgi:hypothetical protein